MTNTENAQHLCQQREDFQKCFIALYLATQVARSGADQRYNGWFEDDPKVTRNKFEILASLSTIAAQSAAQHIAFSNVYVECAIKVVNRFTEEPSDVLDVLDEITPSAIVDELFKEVDDIDELECLND